MLASPARGSAPAPPHTSPASPGPERTASGHPRRLREAAPTRCGAAPSVDEHLRTRILDVAENLARRLPVNSRRRGPSKPWCEPNSPRDSLTPPGPARASRDLVWRPPPRGIGRSPFWPVQNSAFFTCSATPSGRVRAASRLTAPPRLTRMSSRGRLPGSGGDLHVRCAMAPEEAERPSTGVMSPPPAAPPRGPRHAQRPAPGATRHPVHAGYARGQKCSTAWG